MEFLMNYKVFNEFYSNLNLQGQIIFCIIIFLLIILIGLLSVTTILTSLENKNKKKEMLRTIKESKKIKHIITPKIKQQDIFQKLPELESQAPIKVIREEQSNEKTHNITKIANEIQKAMSSEPKPIELTEFEMFEEDSAIISYEELLMRTGKHKKYTEEDEITSSKKVKVSDYLEKQATNKVFMVSKVISPIYGISKPEEEKEETKINNEIKDN